MKSIIKSYDIFGYPITLTYNQSKGASHKTIYGGIATLIIKMALFAIFIQSCNEMFSH
jgi:hypothetical protein